MYISVNPCTVYHISLHKPSRITKNTLHFLKIFFTSANPKPRGLRPHCFNIPWRGPCPICLSRFLEHSDPMDYGSSVEAQLRVVVGVAEDVSAGIFLGRVLLKLKWRWFLKCGGDLSPLRKKLRSINYEYFCCQIGCPLFPGFDSSVRQMDLQHHKVPRFTRCSVFPFTVTCYENEAQPGWVLEGGTIESSWDWKWAVENAA